ncbi:MAG: ergothioneine biosynthesis protein EgtC [Cyanobacteria bacterium]|nr:ergothioneine biosynthesis protein EgtC [Cyanobacteriota bacterium]
MCRLLGYLGPPLSLEKLILEPSHSLVVQSYAPKELKVALLNADGFGLGWHHPTRTTAPFTYRSILPAWNDVNLAPLCRYVESGCVLAYVRSATPGQGLDVSNCQPFQSGQRLFTHNGYITNFRETLYRPMGQTMGDRAYGQVRGSTDSEHIWGLVLSELERQPDRPVETALERALTTLVTLARHHKTTFAANILISDGARLVGCRFASDGPAPSLYWLRDSDALGPGTLMASEPLFEGPWTPCPDPVLFTVEADGNPQFRSLQHLHGPG